MTTLDQADMPPSFRGGLLPHSANCEKLDNRAISMYNDIRYPYPLGVYEHSITHFLCLVKPILTNSVESERLLEKHCSWSGSEAT